jgi:hypothetical protein
MRPFPIKFIIGHGQYLEDKVFKIPPNITILFASKPGYALSQSFLADKTFAKIYKRRYDYIYGNLKGPTQLQRWKSNMFIPGDTIHDLLLHLAPSPGDTPDFNTWCGIDTHRITAPVYLSQIVNSTSMPTVYLVASCRVTPKSSQLPRHHIGRGIGRFDEQAYNIHNAYVNNLLRSVRRYEANIILRRSTAYQSKTKRIRYSDRNSPSPPPSKKSKHV